MRLCRYITDDRSWVGLVGGDDVHPLFEGDDTAGQDALLECAMGSSTPSPIGPSVPIASVRLLEPVPRPPSIRDFNGFEDHAKLARRHLGLEMGPEWYEMPSFYFCSPATVIGPDAEMIPPPSDAIDFELEVAAVIGRDVTDPSPEEALASIAGFTIMNDWSARNLLGREMRHGQGPAKAKDFATSLGAYLVTPDELPDASTGRPRAAMSASVNEITISRGRLEDLHWGWGELLAFAGRDTLLRAGDVVGSGTVASGSILDLIALDGPGSHPYLRTGDVVELHVEGIGSLKNVVGPTRVHPSSPRQD